MPKGCAPVCTHAGVASTCSKFCLGSMAFVSKTATRELL
jgi:hypothetical protein